MALTISGEFFIFSLGSQFGYAGLQRDYIPIDWFDAMNKMTYLLNSYERPDSNPSTAALLSIVPGLGQLYNGERRKGVLFLEVAALNYLLLWLTIWSGQLAEGMSSFGRVMHLKPNGALINAVGQAHWGSPLSMIIAALASMFAVYAVRDAYDKAASTRRRKLYPAYAIELNEAASGSYLFHFAAMATCLVLAAFILVPKPPASQLIEIRFMDKQPPAKPQKHRDIVSQQTSRDSGRVIPDTHVGASAASQSAKQERALPPPASQSAAQSPAQHSPRPTAHVHQATAKPQPSALAPLPVLTASQSAPLPQPAITAPLNAPRLPVPIPSRPLAAAGTMVPAPPVPVNSGRPAVQPVPVPTLLAYNTGNVAPPTPGVNPGRWTTFLHGAPAPVNLSRISTAAAPVPAPAASERYSGAPSVVAPMQIDNSPGVGSQFALAPVGRPSGRERNAGSSSNSAPAPIKVDNGNASAAGNKPAIAIGPVVSGQGSSARPVSSSNGSPLANDHPNGPSSGHSRADVNWGPYMAELQRRIKMNWFPPAGTESKRVVVVFKILRDGSLTHLKVDKSSNSAIADQAALKAVEHAAPFRHLPEGADDDADIQFTFDYNVFGGGKIRQF